MSDEWIADWWDAILLSSFAISFLASLTCFLIFLACSATKGNQWANKLRCNDAVHYSSLPCLHLCLVCVFCVSSFSSCRHHHHYQTRHCHRRNRSFASYLCRLAFPSFFVSHHRCHRVSIWRISEMVIWIESDDEMMKTMSGMRKWMIESQHRGLDLSPSIHQCLCDLVLCFDRDVYRYLLPVRCFCFDLVDDLDLDHHHDRDLDLSLHHRLDDSWNRWLWCGWKRIVVRQKIN